MYRVITYPFLESFPPWKALQQLYEDVGVIKEQGNEKIRRRKPTC